MDNKIIINTPNAPAPFGPYSQAVKINQTLYVSGQIALDPVTNNLITNDIAAETTQVMENIGAILDYAGLSFDHVVKCSIFVNDMGNFTAVNKVYGDYFTDKFPARETVEVSKLPKDVNVEISCVAHL